MPKLFVLYKHSIIIESFSNFILRPKHSYAIRIKDYAELIAKKLNYTGQINWHMQPKREGEIYWLNSGNKLTQNLYNWTPQVTLEDGLNKTIAI